ncbi:MAG: endolytic transglycosylase MltG [Dehalococcoidia bacterium]|nr:endolytic transglycosylase MltG [Dehalococcoidia bacterium]
MDGEEAAVRPRSQCTSALWSSGRYAPTLYALIVAALLALVLRSTAGAVGAALTPREGSPVSARPAAQPVVVTVERGADTSTIVRALLAAGVLAHERQFATLLAYTGGGDALQAGRYEFQRGLPATEVLRRLRDGLSSEHLLTIPEGLRLEQIGELLERRQVVKAAQWAAALEPARTEPLLAARPPGASLLGYLLPASYAVGSSPSAGELLTEMIEAFAERMTATRLDAVRASSMTLHAVLTLASIVEKEAIVPEEQPLIASALLNRLRAGIALQADPTVQFALASRDGGARSWWPLLGTADLAIDSPYNTYRYPGLPPGPIANPGTGAIDAVLHPAQTNYLYFVAHCDGSDRHLFAVTLEQHNANAARCPGR